MLKNGEYLQDRYEILERIGSGGMSDVYKAKCHKLNRLVAVKVLKEEFSADAGFVSRFKMEAQAAAGLSHPNIVNVYDVVDDGDIHYIVMELIEGITLKNYIAKKGKLDVREAIGIAIQIAQGMSAAHDSKIIHRDIKPQNIIISRDGKAKVADFGIARAVSMQTRNADAIGSVHYIAPEQASGNASDERSDIYSFGITLYEMVTGKVPFDGDNVAAIAMAHIEQEPAAPSAENRLVPPELEAIILKCIRKDPQERYGGAAELISDLRRALMSPSDPNRKEEKDAGPQDQGARKKEGHGPRRERRSSQNEEEKDISRHLERLFSIGGVAGAILIVAVVLFLVAKLSGLFNVGRGFELPTNGGPSRAESTIVLKEDQTNIPEVSGITEEAAVARLSEVFLNADVSYEYSETVREGYVMAQDEAGSVVEKGATVHITVSRGSGRVEVAPLELTGKTEAEARAILEANEIQAVIQPESSETVEAGRVIRYEPEAVVYRGESLTLYVSSGPAVQMTTVPNITGLQEEDALEKLEAANLQPGDVEIEYSDTVEEWGIIRQLIPEGTQVPAATAVGYVVSFGQAPIPENTLADGLSEGRDVYVSSIDESFELGPVIGPGSDSTNVPIKIQLRQSYKGKTHVKVLQDTETVQGDSVITVYFPEIIGIYGVTEGTVEVVNAQTGRVLESYPVTFEHEE